VTHTHYAAPLRSLPVCVERRRPSQASSRTVTNPYSRASSVVAVQGVKGLVTDFGSRWDAAVTEHRLNDLQRELALTELEMTIFEISSRT